MQNDQYGQNSQNGAQNNQYGIQNNQYGIQNNPYPNVAYPPVQYGPAVQPAPYQQAPSAVNSGKSKKTAMIFCIISNVLMVLGVLAIPFLFVMILAMGFGAVGETFFMALLIAAACALGPIASLALAIAAKVKNRKSVWAIVNIVISCFVIIIPVYVAVRFYQTPASEYMQETLSVETVKSDEHPYYDELNACLEYHEFDVVETRITNQHTNSFLYSVKIYISSDATDDDIAEIEEYLRELRDICKIANQESTYACGMQVTVGFYYFDPNEEEICFLDRLNMNSLTRDSKLEIQPRIDDALEKGYLSKGTVPSEIGYDDVMIVVY